MKANNKIFLSTLRFQHKTNASLINYGIVESVSSGIARLTGLANVKSGELVTIFPANITAIALNLEADRVGVVLCGAERFVHENDIVILTGRLISLNVNEDILGTVVNPLGVNLMTNKTLVNGVPIPLEQEAPDIISRQPIFEPLITGLTIVDSLVPIGRGQRELIIGDRQTGKTSVTIDAILN